MQCRFCLRAGAAGTHRCQGLPGCRPQEGRLSAAPLVFEGLRRGCSSVLGEGAVMFSSPAAGVPHAAAVCVARVCTPRDLVFPKTKYKDAPLWSPVFERFLCSSDRVPLRLRIDSGALRRFRLSRKLILSETRVPFGLLCLRSLLSVGLRSPIPSPLWFGRFGSVLLRLSAAFPSLSSGSVASPSLSLGVPRRSRLTAKSVAILAQVL